MAGKGGYQKPNKPALSSGPGKFAKRTDGGPGDTRQAQMKIPSNAYGEGVQTAAIQAGAPLAATGGFGAVSPTPPRIEAIPMSAPTQRPTEPITTGIDLGPGAGSSVLGLAGTTQSQYQSAAQLIQALAQDPNASPTMKYLAQRIQQVF